MNRSLTYMELVAGALLVLLASVLPARGVAPNMLGSRDAAEIVDSETDRYWKAARKEIYRSAQSLLAQRNAEVASGVRYRTLVSGNPAHKQVALTFDDGPHPYFTPRILSILADSGVPATFFVVGEMAEKYPSMVRQEMSAGHCVGNHTYHHLSLVKLDPEDAAVEIKACGKVLQDITARAPHLFRPPGGEYDPEVAEIASRLGYTMVLWTDDPGDYARPSSGTIESRIVRRIAPGAIILIHDGIPQTITMLPRLIRDLKRRGYDLVTVDQLIGGLARSPQQPAPTPRTDLR